jgi:hypothetical protein
MNQIASAVTYSGTLQALASCIVFGGDLFFGTNGHGLLLKLTGSTLTVVAGNYHADLVNVVALAEFEGDLYGLLGASSAVAAGKLVKWNGVDSWTLVANQTDASYTAGDLRVFDSKLYAVLARYNLGLPAKLVKLNSAKNGYDFVAEYSDLVDGYDHSSAVMCEFESNLYLGTYRKSATGSLLVLNGTTLTQVTDMIAEDQRQIKSMVVHNNRLVCGTGQDGKALRLNADKNNFETAANGADGQSIINDMIVTSGNKLLAVTSSGGRVFNLLWGR